MDASERRALVWAPFRSIPTEHWILARVVNQSYRWAGNVANGEGKLLPIPAMGPSKYIDDPTLLQEIAERQKEDKGE